MVELITKTTNDDRLLRIADHVKDEKRISEDDALYLYERAPIGYLGSLANHIREKRHGKKVFFNRNFHVEPTNV